MVIAVKKEDRVVVGVTAADGLANMTKRDLALEENLPFWKVKGVKDCYAFSEDMNYATDLLRYNDGIFKNFTDMESLIRDVVPKMRELLKGYGMITETAGWCSTLILVKEGKAYEITPHFTVCEVEDFSTHPFEGYAMGALEESKDMPFEESILFALRKVNEIRCRNLFPLMIFDCKSKKKKVFYQ